jgi:CDP-2,3-bis-(O-geranylgeranyl)-sn-glycerol synthase
MWSYGNGPKYLVEASNERNGSCWLFPLVYRWNSHRLCIKRSKKEMLETILQAFLIILPAYFANGSAVILGGGKPIDGGKIWRNKRVLGDGKTWWGLLGGTTAGVLFGWLVLECLLNNYLQYNIVSFGGTRFSILILFSICFGALLGDIIKSFFKRRLGKDRGTDWIPFDQLDFIVGALVGSYTMSYILSLFFGFNWFTEHITWYHILILFLVTPAIHILANRLWKKRRAVNEMFSVRKKST